MIPIEDRAVQLRHDPLGWVRYAYDWGEGDLAAHAGPRAWQAGVLEQIGAHLQNPATRYQPLQIAVASGHGVGKAHPLSAMVETPAGRRCWGDIQPGDLLFDADGRPVRVKARRDYDDAPLLRVTFNDGSIVDCSTGHLWRVKGRNQRRTGAEWVTLEAAEIMRRGVTRSNGIASARQWEVPRQGPAQYPAQEVPIHPYVLGLWLGDGGRLKGTITSNDPDTLLRLQSLGLKISQGTKQGTTALTLGIGGLLVQLRAIGVLENYSYEKSVPSLYLRNSEDIRAEILRGLLDTDGEANRRGTIIFSSTSEQLARDVIWLARSLGGKACMQPTVKMPSYPGPNGEKMAGRPCWRATLAMPAGFRAFYVERKQARIRPQQERYLARWIADIHTIPPEPSMCVEVEGGLYQAGDFVVTHNSALIAMVIDWAMSTCRDTRAVITANTEPQLRTKTWPEVSKWANLSINADWWKVPALSMYAADAQHEKSWRADAIAWSEHNTEAFAGLHNEGKRIVVVFDESSKIADKVWEVAEGALTDENTEIIWLAFGNPTQATGRFRECFGRFKHLWQTIQIDSRTVEGTNKEYLRKQVEAHGEDSDIVRVRVRGVFPAQSVAQFIPTDQVEAAQVREVLPDRGAPLVLGVDIARFGDDQSVIRFRSGRDARTMPPIKWRNRDTVFSANKIAECIKLYNPAAVFVDGGGVGAGVIDILRSWGYRVIEVAFGAGANDPKEYANKRAEMWGDMREWLKTGSIDDDQELRDDLIGPEYHYDRRTNALLLESKDDMKARGLASPDDGDALAMTFAGPVARLDQATALAHGRNAVAQTDYDVFQ